MTDVEFYITWILLMVTIFTAGVQVANEDDVRSRTRPQRIRVMRKAK